MKNENELPDIEKAEIYLNSLIESKKQIITELEDLYGVNNVKDFFYSEHRGAWIVLFKNDIEDQEFDIFAGMMEWLQTEGNEE